MRWDNLSGNRRKETKPEEPKRRKRCAECGKYWADWPSDLCPDCERSLENPFAAEREIERLRAVNADMLAALKGLVTTIYARPDMQRLIGPAEEQQITKAVYVIAKAEGRS